jgi:hypothetical protein
VGARVAVADLGTEQPLRRVVRQHDAPGAVRQHDRLAEALERAVDHLRLAVQRVGAPAAREAHERRVAELPQEHHEGAEQVRRRPALPGERHGVGVGPQRERAAERRRGLLGPQATRTGLAAGLAADHAAGLVVHERQHQVGPGGARPDAAQQVVERHLERERAARDPGRPGPRVRRGQGEHDPRAGGAARSRGLRQHRDPGLERRRHRRRPRGIGGHVVAGGQDRGAGRRLAHDSRPPSAVAHAMPRTPGVARRPAGHAWKAGAPSSGGREERAQRVDASTSAASRVRGLRAAPTSRGRAPRASASSPAGPRG